jgi:hypothetical protein
LLLFGLRIGLFGIIPEMEPVILVLVRAGGGDGAGAQDGENPRNASGCGLNGDKHRAPILLVGNLTQLWPV